MEKQVTQEATGSFIPPTPPSQQEIDQHIVQIGCSLSNLEGTIAERLTLLADDIREKHSSCFRPYHVQHVGIDLHRAALYLADGFDEFKHVPLDCMGETVNKLRGLMETEVGGQPINDTSKVRYLNWIANIEMLRDELREEVSNAA